MLISGTDGTTNYDYGWKTKYDSDIYGAHKYNNKEPKESNGVVVSLSQLQNEQEQSIQESSSKPQDASPELTQRLVGASWQLAVRQVIAEANKNIVSLQMIAAGNGKDAELARSYVKKLEKLINRATRKIKDLDDEDILKLERVRAEQTKQQQRREQIEAQLRRQKRERTARENGYLLEQAQEQMEQLDPSVEAQIQALAQAIVSAETSAPGVQSFDINIENYSGDSTNEAQATPSESDI